MTAYVAVTLPSTFAVIVAVPGATALIFAVAESLSEFVSLTFATVGAELVYSMREYAFFRSVSLLSSVSGALMRAVSVSSVKIRLEFLIFVPFLS